MRQWPRIWSAFCRSVEALGGCLVVVAAARSLRSFALEPTLQVDAYERAVLRSLKPGARSDGRPASRKAGLRTSQSGDRQTYCHLHPKAVPWVSEPPTRGRRGYGAC